MQVKLDEGTFEPERAHSTDAGLDIRSRECKVIRGNSSEIFHTGVHVILPSNTCGLLVSKSGLNAKHNITSTGLIDEGYTGEIVVKLYNHSNDDYYVNIGDKITQLVILPVMYSKINIVTEIDCSTERGNNGFGSTGK